MIDDNDDDDDDTWWCQCDTLLGPEDHSLILQNGSASPEWWLVYNQNGLNGIGDHSKDSVTAFNDDVS